jgi:hypothetical protein
MESLLPLPCALRLSVGSMLSLLFGSRAGGKAVRFASITEIYPTRMISPQSLTENAKAC